MTRLTPPRPPTPPPLPPASVPPRARAASRSPEKLRRELITFHFGIAVIIGTAAILTLVYLSSSAPPLLGLPRKLAFGLPLCVVALIHLLGGVWLVLRVNVTAALLCVVGPVVLGATYIITMSAALGSLPINPLTILLVSLPIFAGLRVVSFFRALPLPPPLF